MLIVLAWVVLFEAALLWLAAAFLVYELLVDTPWSYGGAVMIALLTAGAAVWVTVMGVHTLRARPWIRGAVLTWQFLQAGIAIGSFQGAWARPELGWLLLVPAVIAVILVLSRSVVAATRVSERSEGSER